MTNALLDTITDDSQTCTVDEAAAKLLGWMRSPIRLKTVQFSRKGYRAEDLPHLPGLSTPLLETLQSFRDWAEDDLIRAIDDGTDLTAIDEACARLDRWEEQHKHAVSFLAAIRRELAKEKKSELQIDEAATAANADEKHVTLDSLDRWALHNYGVSVRADSVAPAVPREFRPEKEIPADKGLSRTKAEGLQISFALLVEEYAGPKSGYQKSDGTPNVKVLADHIEWLAEQANQGSPMPGQSSEAIRERIEAALRLKDEGF